MWNRSGRYMRDPDGIFSHTILTVKGILIELPPLPPAQAAPPNSAGTYLFGLDSNNATGKMDRVLTIQRLTATAPDDAGVPVKTWSDLCHAPGREASGAAADTEHNEIAISDTRVKLQTWYYDCLNSLEDRATYEGGTYQIKYLSEIGRRRGLEIHIEKLGDQ